MIKNICKKSIANFIIDGERQNAFSLSLGTRQEYLLSLYACLLSQVQLFLTLWAVSCQASLCMEFFFFFSGKNTGVGCRFLFQGSNSSLLGLLHCRQTLFTLSHWGRLAFTCFHYSYLYSAGSSSHCKARTRSKKAYRVERKK